MLELRLTEVFCFCFYFGSASGRTSEFNFATLRYMHVTKSVVEAAAVEARYTFEHAPDELDRGLLKNLYQTYNPTMENPVGFVDAAINSFPNGACGLASVYIQHLLAGADEVECTRAIYLESNGTATQFWYWPS